MTTFSINYTIKVTKTAKKQGRKLNLSGQTLNWLINQVKLLKFWPENSAEFDYEKVGEAYEFKFDHVEDKWIRVFIYQDDIRKILWVIKVMAKKQNSLTQTDHISLQTAISQMKQDLNEYNRLQLKEVKLNSLIAIKGGKDEK